jgi:hypothetical protein
VTALRPRCKNLLGDGMRRRVYAHPDRPDLVVKIAKTDLSKTWLGAPEKGSPVRREADYSNPGEWAAWTRVQGTDLERFFVPCVSMSKDGVELVQQRAEIIDDLPPDLPQWLYIDADWHGASPRSPAFGIYDGVPRLVDYAHHKILEALDALLR